MSTASNTSTTTRRRSPWPRRWPSALGLAAAAVLLTTGLLTTGATREPPAIAVCIAALCCLGAAALARPWLAWA